MKKIYEMAKINYPENWNRAMIDKLHEKSRLTDEEYADIIGEDTGALEKERSGYKSVK